jgi:hypothetical protein
VQDSSHQGPFIPSPTVDAVLKTFGFSLSREVEGRTSIADLFPSTKRCGIYVLEFKTGEVYGGQAVDVTRRYAQHLKTHKDVTKIHFQQVGKSKLDAVEEGVI